MFTDNQKSLGRAPRAGAASIYVDLFVVIAHWTCTFPCFGLFYFFKEF